LFPYNTIFTIWKSTFFYVFLAIFYKNGLCLSAAKIRLILSEQRLNLRQMAGSGKIARLYHCRLSSKQKLRDFKMDSSPPVKKDSVCFPELRSVLSSQNYSTRQVLLAGVRLREQ